jgi:hypothetical protein
MPLSLSSCIIAAAIVVAIVTVAVLLFVRVR